MIAGAIVGLVAAYVFVRVWWRGPSVPDEYVTPAWRNDHLRGRRE
jgi:hypothetical protein